MTRDEILAASAMPPAAPSYGPGPYRHTDRAVLAIDYETDADAVHAALPAPLEPDGAVVTVSFIDVPASDFGAYGACVIALAATLDGAPVAYYHALYTAQEAPLFGGREIWGFPCLRGEADLIHGENRVTGTLDLGYGRVIRASTPVQPEGDDAARAAARAAIARTRICCKLVPDAAGGPAIAQLIAVAPDAVSVKGCWHGAGELESGPDGPLAGFPVVRLIAGRYTLADLTLPYGRVVHDYLANGFSNGLADGA